MVIREVIKEVPVERIVTQEVIKEVAVEKIVARSSAPAATAAPAPAPTVRPAATTFQDNRRQPVVATADDAVSTFSLDTDRTSYQVALNWARQGYDIEPDSVRAEEWINAFNYQYAPPADAWGFAITSDLVAHPLNEGKHLARIGFQAAEVPDDRPLNVTLVLDASGSMREGNRVGIARAAAETIRQSLRPQDRVAVVHFTRMSFTTSPWSTRRLTTGRSSSPLANWRRMAAPTCKRDSTWGCGWPTRRAWNGRMPTTTSS